MTPVECHKAIMRLIKLNLMVQEDLMGKEKRNKGFYLFMMKEQQALLEKVEHQLSLMRRKNKSHKQ